MLNAQECFQIKSDAKPSLGYICMILSVLICAPGIV